ncbi:MULTISPECIES: DUF89 domain-containing protein [unclassified Marichromatium]|uniref:damage-control phosphatase ARMT1 family protein n=1 Tax=unclassified Marichromatium TaxID=2618417 RepID=UPI000F3E4053|nr:ARMT1-like domain-containing protein [Marichromatium sp. AB31]RNE88642.1 DUF89 family protein [Marichromatium sp. AB31]
MHTHLDCYPCFLRQALSAARRAGADQALQHAILVETMAELQRLPLDTTPPRMAETIHRLVRTRTGAVDPYLAAKQEATRRALDLYPRLIAAIAASADPLETAVRGAIAGNIIDFGVFEHYDLEATLDRVLRQPFAIDDLAVLRAALARVDRVLYLGDNAGETVFDRALIEQLDQPVTYVCKGGPAINDATLEDARAAGLDGCASLVDNGSDAVGTLLDRCSDEFRARFAAAPLIIAKGQANYESLSEVEAPIVFLLQAKCGVIADDIGVPTGGLIVKAAPGLAR